MLINYRYDGTKQQGALQTAERRFFIVEKFFDMRYNKLPNFAGVTGDFRKSVFMEKKEYEKRM